MIASVDTYLRFAEATNRLDLYEQGGKDLTEAIGDLQEGGAAKKTSGAVRGAKKAIKGGSEDDDDDDRPADVLAASTERRMPEPTPAASRPGTTSTAWCPADAGVRRLRGIDDAEVQ